MTQKKQIYSHLYENEIISFEKIEDSTMLEFKRNFIYKMFFKNFIKPKELNTYEEIKILNKNFEIYKIIDEKAYNQKANKSNFMIEGRFKLYTSDGHIFYDKGELIIVTNEKIDIPEVEKLTEGKVIDNIQDFFLIKYKSSDLADAQYEKIKDQDWIKHIEKNFSTDNSIISHNDNSNIKPPPNIEECKELPVQNAFSLTDVFKVHDLINKDNRIQGLLSKTKIAILDTGVDMDHPDLKSHIDKDSSWDFVKNRRKQNPNKFDPHGTHCSGLIIAKKSNNVGVNGVAKGSNLISYRIGVSDPYYGFQFDIYSLCKAMLKAIDSNVDVINCSWTTNKPFETLKYAIQKATQKGRNSKGIVVVVSAGNSGKLTPFPANLDNVITVSAIDENGIPCKKCSIENHTWASNYGPKVDIAAPGVNLITTDIRYHYGKVKTYGSCYNYYLEFGGTSGAAPQVAACAAIILSLNSNLSAKQVKELIRSNSSDFPDSHNLYVNNYGKGILNVFKSINNLINHD